MIKYDHFICEDARDVTESLEDNNIQPNQIISIVSKVKSADTYKYDYSGTLDIHVDTYYVVFYWYNEN